MTIARKFTIWITAIIMVLGGATIYLYYTFEMDEEIKRLDSPGNTVGALLEQSLDNYMLTKDYNALNKTLHNIAGIESTGKILLINRDGVVKGGTDKELMGKKLSFDDPRCKRCHEKGRRGHIVRDEKIFRWVQPISNKPECYRCHSPSIKYNGIFSIDFSLSESEKHVKKDILRGFSIFIPSIIIVGFVVIFLSNRLVIKKLSIMADKIRKFKKGDYRTRLIVENDDEISRLEENFNEMAEAINVRDREKDELFNKLSTSYEALRQSRVKYKGLVDSIDGVVWEADAQTFRFSFVSEQAERLLGYPVEQWLNEPAFWKDHLHSDDRKWAPEFCMKATNEKKAHDFEYRMIAADGRVIWIRDIVTVVIENDKAVKLRGLIIDITERKAIEDAFRKSDDNLKLAQKVAHIGSWHIDIRNNELSWSDESYRMFGLPLNTPLTYEIFLNIIHPEDRDYVDRNWKAALSMQPYDIEHRIIVEGKIKWVHEKAELIFNDKGTPLYATGTVQDITGRKQAEKAIEKGSKLNAALFESARAALKHSDFNDAGREIYFHCKEMIGATAGYVALSSEDGTRNEVIFLDVGQSECTVDVSIPMPIRGMREEAYRSGKALYHNDYQKTEWMKFIPEGHATINNVMFAPMMIKGKGVGLLGFANKPGGFTDDDARIVSEFTEIATVAFVSYKAEKALIEQIRLVSQSQKEWQNTFDSITDLVSIHDTNYNIIKANRAFEKHFGLSAKEVINRKCYEVFHGTGIEMTNCPHKITIAENLPATEDILDPKTNRILRVSTFPYYSPDGDLIGSVHIARDVTEEKEKEMRLIMNERLASLGLMASGIAHEINNPLASIAGCAERLGKKVKGDKYDSELFGNYLGMITEEVLRCKNITTNMLSFVRTTSHKKNVDVNQIVEKTLEIIGFQGRPEKIQVVRNYAEEHLFVKGDEGALRQAVLAIIINSLDAMQDSGTLTLETGKEGDKVFIKIADTGPGIPSEIVHNIFNPFFTTKSDSGGTGLGLSIAKRIVLDHEGEIDVTSEEGKGTIFRIVLPAV